MRMNNKILLLRVFTAVVVLGSFASIFFFTGYQTRPKIEGPFAAVNKFLDKDQADSAISILLSFVAHDRTNPVAYHLLGKANFQKGELFLARNYLISSLKSDPNQPQVRAFLAEIDFDLAEKYWQQDKREALFYLISVVRNTEDADLMKKVAQLTGGAYRIEQLTFDIFSAGGPSFSPDGKKIIYHSDTSYYSEEYPLGKKVTKRSKLFLLDLTQSKRICLTQEGLSESFARFSPDGKRIVFQREKPVFESSGRTLNPEQNLILKNLETGEEKELTSEEGYEGLASFFPQGDRIVYARGYGICVMDLKDLKSRNIFSSGENLLTRLQIQPLLEPISPFYPNLSPDGKKVVFQAGFERRAIYLMGLRDSKTVCLSSGEKEEGLYPSFSPDGKKILFLSKDELCLMDTKGKNRIRLTNDKSEKKTPLFSPDGKRILFCAKPKGKEDNYFELYLLSLTESISKTDLNKRLRRIAESL